MWCYDYEKKGNQRKKPTLKGLLLGWWRRASSERGKGLQNSSCMREGEREGQNELSVLGKVSLSVPVSHTHTHSHSSSISSSLLSVCLSAHFKPAVVIPVSFQLGQLFWKPQAVELSIESRWTPARGMSLLSPPGEKWCVVEHHQVVFISCKANGVWICIYLHDLHSFSRWCRTWKRPLG